MARKAIKKSLRFEVFKRDSFTCQYCGRKAPDVVLEIDHITPVSGGGGNDILNLITACRSCNSGKSDRKLQDSVALDKRRAQMEDLEERRQQLQMLHDWHVSLIDLDDQAIDLCESLWKGSVADPSFQWTRAARDEIRKCLRRHGFDATCEGIREAAAAALRSPRISLDKDAVTNEWFWKIGNMVCVLKLKEKDPGAARLFYIRGICRKSLDYCIEWEAIELLQEAYRLNIGLSWLERLAKSQSSYQSWRKEMRSAIKEERQAQEWEKAEQSRLQDEQESTHGTHP